MSDNFHFTRKKKRFQKVLKAFSGWNLFSFDKFQRIFLRNFKGIVADVLHEKESI